MAAIISAAASALDAAHAAGPVRAAAADHTDVLATRFGIAQQMTARGGHAGAGSEFRSMLPYLHRRLGPDHPHTLAAAEWADRDR